MRRIYLIVIISFLCINLNASSFLVVDTNGLKLKLEAKVDSKVIKYSAQGDIFKNIKYLENGWVFLDDKYYAKEKYFKKVEEKKLKLKLLNDISTFSRPILNQKYFKYIIKAGEEINIEGKYYEWFILNDGNYVDMEQFLSDDFEKNIISEEKNNVEMEIINDKKIKNIDSLNPIDNSNKLDSLIQNIKENKESLISLNTTTKNLKANLKKIDLDTYKNEINIFLENKLKEIKKDIEASPKLFISVKDDIANSIKKIDSHIEHEYLKSINNKDLYEILVFSAVNYHLLNNKTKTFFIKVVGELSSKSILDFDNNYFKFYFMKDNLNRELILEYAEEIKKLYDKKIIFKTEGY